MKEEFLHFIWKNGLFNNHPFTTVDGKSVVVIDPGLYNRDSGPDFFNSRVIIGGTLWAGNVEIHTSSSLWEAHQHHHDHSYDNVILHVVYKFDRDVYTASGIKLDTAELRWNRAISDRYNQYIRKPYILACRDDLNFVDNSILREWINRVATERLINKARAIKPELSNTRGDWEEVIYRLIAKYFGSNVNSEPFSMLAAKLPLRIIRKHSGDIVQVEALLFGMAGMLEPGLFREVIEDDYYSLIQREFKLLRLMYSLVPMDGWIWKFNRMRPANFPTIRIAQLASLLVSGEPLFASVKEAKTPDELYKIFDHHASLYWTRHYIFGKASGESVKRIGDSTKSMLIINCVVPLLLLYGREYSKQEYCEKAIDIAERIKPESNRIVKEWVKMGFECHTILETQGVVELRERYCKNRACLSCLIGYKLISLGRDKDPREKLILEDPIS